MRGLGRRCEWQTLSEYELNQILAEAVHKLGGDRIMQCVAPRNYGWPIPPGKRHVVATAVALFVHWSKT
jgi:hypothetical protein